MSTNAARIFAFSQRPDELAFFEAFARAEGIELGATPEAPRPGNLHLARGHECVSVVTTSIGPDIVEGLHAEGVRFISTRTIGYDHVHLPTAKRLGLRVGNTPYSADSVAGYAVMLMLMVTRRFKAISMKAGAQDFSLAGSRGVELPNLTVGIAGTGRIGRRVIENLAGFGCPILAHDLYPNPEVAKRATYVSWPELCARSDLISLHLPYTKENHHLVNRESLAGMKDGVYLVNTARGSLVDTQALLEALESGKVGGAGLDVIEDESELIYHDLRNRPLRTRDWALLGAYPNVVLTPHTAFYTDQAVRDMVENSLRSCLAFLRGQDNPWEIAI